MLERLMKQALQDLHLVPKSPPSYPSSGGGPQYWHNARTMFSEGLIAWDRWVLALQPLRPEAYPTAELKILIEPPSNCKSDGIANSVTLPPLSNRNGRNCAKRALSFEVNGGAVESDISVPEPGLNLHLGMRRKIVIIAKVDTKEGGSISPVPDGSFDFSSGRAAFLGEGVARCRDGQLEAVPSGCIEEWDAADNWSTHGLTRFEGDRVIGRNR